MNTRKKLIVGIIIGLVVIVGGGAAAVIATKAAESNSMKTGMAAGGAATVDTSKAVATDTVAIKDFAFTPDVITVKRGTKVTWTNNDAVRHSVTSDDGQSISFDSGLIAQGATYSYTFDKAGTYSYYCTPHPYMKANVVVTE